MYIIILQFFPHSVDDMDESSSNFLPETWETWEFKDEQMSIHL